MKAIYPVAQMSPSFPGQITSLLSRLSSSCGIPGIMYMAFGEYLNAIGQPLLGMGPAQLDANGGTFVASLVPLERTTEASACSSRARHPFGYLRRKTSQDYAKYLGVRAERGKSQWEVAESKILIKCKLLPYGRNGREVAPKIPVDEGRSKRRRYQATIRRLTRRPVGVATVPRPPGKRFRHRARNSISIYLR